MASTVRMRTRSSLPVRGQCPCGRKTHRMRHKLCRRCYLQQRPSTPLRRWRDAVPGRSLLALAEATQISRRQIHRIASGEDRPCEENAKKLHEHTGIPIDVLIANGAT